MYGVQSFPGERGKIHRFNSIYSNEAAGWNIGRPQDPVRYPVESGQIQGDVLDVGCGTGLHTRYMASKGLEVLGIDFSAEAIYRAKQNAYQENSSAEFLVWNALNLSGLNRSFDTVLDSAMMHSLSRTERPEYVEELGKVLRPGGRAFIICSQQSVPVWEIRALFREWSVVYVLETRYTYTSNSIPAFLICVEKA